MNIIIKGLHMDITPAIDTYVRKKVQSFVKFIDSNSKLEIGLSKTTRHHKSEDAFKAEFKIFSKGEYVQGAAEAEDLYAAIDLARDELLMILSSKKDKRMTMWRRGGQRIKSLMRGFNFKKNRDLDI